MARLGLGVMLIPAKPRELVEADLAAYRKAFQAIHGRPGHAPISVCFVYCDDDAGRAEQVAQKYLSAYQLSAFKHYGMTEESLPALKGYESYKAAQQALSAPGGIDAAVKAFIKTQAWGTPEMCLREIAQTPRTGWPAGVDPGVQLRRYALRSGRTQHAAVRRRTAAGAQENRPAGTANGHARRHRRRVVSHGMEACHWSLYKKEKWEIQPQAFSLWLDRSQSGSGGRLFRQQLRPRYLRARARERPGAGLYLKRIG